MLKNILDKLFGTTVSVAANTNNVKECGKCRRLLEVAAFNRHNKRRDGLQCWCKDCMSKSKPAKRFRSPSTRMRRIREGQKHIKLSFVVTPEQRIVLDEICRSKKTTISRMINGVVRIIVHEHKTNGGKTL